MPDNEKMVVVDKIETERLEKIKTFAKENSIRFSDTLLAGVYFTVKKWNDRLGMNQSGRITFYTTFGLRGKDTLSLGNFASGMFINFSAGFDLNKFEVLKIINRARNFFQKNNTHLIL